VKKGMGDLGGASNEVQRTLKVFLDEPERFGQILDKIKAAGSESKSNTK
jgi:hypothetical protein